MESEALTQQEQVRLMRLLELIRSTNRLISLHQDDDESSRFSIKQYEELKAEYLQELENLMMPFGVHIQQAA
jgi:tRNA A37 N6-isopentenylltransferase MiaA